MSRPVDADKPIWFTPNRRRYHKKSLVNSSLCASDRKPTKVPCAPLPPLAANVVPCELCIAKTEAAPEAAQALITGIEAVQDFVIEHSGDSPLAYLNVGPDGEPTQYTPYLVVLGLAVGGIVDELGPQEALRLCLATEALGGAVTIRDATPVSGYLNVIDFAIMYSKIDHDLIRAGIRYLVSSIAALTKKPTPPPTLMSVPASPTFCIEIVPPITGSTLGDPVVAPGGRVISLPGPKVSELMKDADTARAWAKTNLPDAIEISYEEMSKHTKMGNNEIQEISEDELAELDSLEGIDLEN